jgi:hypothetical protein
MLFESMLAIGAVLLIGSGGMKLIDRAPTRGALEAAGLPSSTFAVLVLAVLEITVGTAALVADHPASALAVAGVYLGFGAFVGYALANDVPIQSCGCFGRVDTPPSVAHLALNGAFALAAVVVALTGSLAGRLDTGTVFETSGILFMASIGAYLSYLLLSEFPTLMRLVRGNE